MRSRRRLFSDAEGPENALQHIFHIDGTNQRLERGGRGAQMGGRHRRGERPGFPRKTKRAEFFGGAAEGVLVPSTGDQRHILGGWCNLIGHGASNGITELRESFAGDGTHPQWFPCGGAFSATSW